LPKITPVLQVIGAAIGVIVAVVLAVITGLVNGFIRALPFIIGFFDKVFSIVGDVTALVIALFTGKWSQIPKILGAIGSDAWGVVTNFFGMIAHFVLGFVQGVIGFFQMLWDKLTKHSIIPEMITDILNCFKSLPGALLKVGQDMITGLINGITGMANNIKNAITNTIGGAVNAAKNMLGIHSPSVVFMEIGRQTVEGYALGVTRNMGLVHDAWGTMTAGGSTTNVTNNYGAPGPAYGLTKFEIMSDKIRYNHYALQSGRLPVTYGQLPYAFDLNYRQNYQRTA
jgi:phage-related protein